jgi:hypothetical protein
MQKSSTGDNSSTHSSVLLDPSVLQNVLSYVGLGHHLFVAPVSNLWREMYCKLERQLLTVYNERRKATLIRPGPQTTMFSSVMAAPSRVELAHESGLDCTSTAYQHAAGRHADIVSLTTAHNMGMKYTAATMAGAALCNKLAVVQYLHSQGCAWPSRLLEVACRCGHFQLVRWCYEHGCPWTDISNAPHYAAASGNVELMAWVLQLPGAELSQGVLNDAARMGDTAMCEYLHSQQCPWNAYATCSAAQSGNVDLLRWLIDNGCPWDAHQPELYRAAASGGSVDMLTYLQQAGLLTSTELLTDMLDCAARYNKLAAAQWLREQGAEWPAVYYWRPWGDAVVEWAIAEGFEPPAN